MANIVRIPYINIKKYFIFNVNVVSLGVKEPEFWD
jgi:hypothetical protein